MKRAAVAIGLWALAGGVAAATPLLELMKQEVDPAANAFWAAGNDPPEGEGPQAADARWAAAAVAAAKLEADGRLLTRPEHSRPGEWDAYAEMMEEAAAAGRIAIGKRDVEAAFEAGGRLYEACAGCHARYIPGRGG
ncbi:hypothetical protein ACFODL_11275 [Phenylobacterium terrae]|uniref:Cytochrome c domain-containing protein n=1 Tax=Phenylobacterium terrae TaxID=2665495 RepID=A0ABW4MYU7_9CAUL